MEWAARYTTAGILSAARACLHTSVSAWSSITRTVTRRGKYVCFQENVEKAQAPCRNATVWYQTLTERLVFVGYISYARSMYTSCRILSKSYSALLGTDVYIIFYHAYIASYIIRIHTLLLRQSTNPRRPSTSSSSDTLLLSRALIQASVADQKASMYMILVQMASRIDRCSVYLQGRFA